MSDVAKRYIVRLGTLGEVAVVTAVDYAVLAGKLDIMRRQVDRLTAERNALQTKVASLYAQIQYEDEDA